MLTKTQKENEQYNELNKDVTEMKKYSAATEK